MSHLPLVEWDSYPSSALGTETYLDDSYRMRELLAEKAGVTFVSNPAHISLEVTLSPVMSADNTAKVSTSVHAREELEKLLLEHRNLPVNWMFIISQNTSWSLLKITLQMFRMLGAFLNVLSSFIEIAISFGAKTWDCDEYYTACYRRFQWDSRTSTNYYEICYNVRFVELHGRSKPANPWSFRQYAVYQRYDYRSRACAWIIIRHKDSFRNHLSKPNLQGIDTCPWSPFYLHFLLLKSSSASWRWYLNHLTTALDKTRLKVVCQLDPKRTYGHDDVNFAQCQSLELLRTQAKHAVAILESTISLAENMRSHLTELLRIAGETSASTSSGPNNLETEFAQLSQQLNMYKRKAQDIVANAKSVNLLTQSVIERRDVATSHASDAQVRQHSAIAASEGRAMVIIGEAGRKDARVMKIVSVIALGYLPIGLVVSFFSTDLVHLTSLVTDVRRGLGVFFLLATLLTISTISMAYVWIRRDNHRKKNALVAIS